MMAAISCAAVPKFTVIVGNSIGPTNFVMVKLYMSYIFNVFDDLNLFLLK